VLTLQSTVQVPEFISFGTGYCVSHVLVRCHGKCAGTCQMHLWKVYVKGPIHSKLNFAVLPLKKTAQKLNRMFSGTAQVSYQVCRVFLVSGLCVFLCV
jgi:hypothetical protein